MDDVTVRKLVPRRERDPGEWEVRGDGKIIGTIKETRIPHTRSTFYNAYGIHPGTGQQVELQASTDFEERVRVIVQLQDDPESLRQHWAPWSWERLS